MTPETLSLSLTALVVGLVHTALGPDHYLPFVALARAREWSLTRTLGITALCGAAHIVSSVILGVVGFFAGWAVFDLVAFEGARGELAAWLLLALGLAYTVWGLRWAQKAKLHTHVHVHADGVVHRHEHGHHGDHAHVHAVTADRSPAATWGLFLVFVFGPCEPLIPLFIYPAARGGSTIGLLAVIAAFAGATLMAMLILVALGYHAARGLARRAPLALERWSHALAGATLVVCGLLIQLGL